MKNIQITRRFSPFFLFVLLFAIGLIAGCEDTTPPQNPTTEPAKIDENNHSTTSSESGESAGSEVFILNTHATSEGSGSASWNLFDNKENTIWMTNFGTGQGESIRINFIPTRENYVEKMSIKTQAGGKITRLRKVAIDVNGKYFGVFNTDNIFSIKKNLRSLTIHFSLTDDLATSEKEVDGGLRELQNSSAKKAIGITDILMFDENGAKITVRDVQNYNGSITAGSTLEPTKLYAPAHLFDGNETLAWVEGAEGEGVGEILKFDLIGEAPAEKLIFYNGYQRSHDHFEWNTRVKSFSIKTENQKPQTFTLRDDMTPQILTFDPPFSGKKYELEILEVFPGEKYKDLAISELSFIRADNQAWKVKTNYKSEKVKFALQTDIGNIVDRYISCMSEEDGAMATQSLILRSDGSFDLHSVEDTGYDDVRDWRASGTWIRRSNGKLKLTGGLSVVGDERTSSFSETLTIKPGYVEGEETFDKIYLK